MENNLFDVKDKVVIITGGLGLLGSEYVKVFRNAGAIVVIFDLKNGVDITKKDEVKKAVRNIIKNFGKVPTVLINNAGLGSIPNAPSSENGPFEDYPEESWDAMMNSHLKGMFFVSQEVVREMKEAKVGGSIINISSTYGVVTPDQSMYEFRRKNGEEYYKPIGYTVAKAGVLGFTKWLAEYCGPFGIRVNTLVPGGVDTEDLVDEFRKEYSKRTILGRMAQPTDYNGAILFLASDASSYITGATIIVDGGWTAR
ncbi:SDR family oxidoreductase [Patescibacteria group bacterium]|nr:SDR family oxidoreductase [Patescibacteria group bacterium]MBU2633259.1 SDR family oxidoreductase [Patescibacteria group bacterium]